MKKHKELRPAMSENAWKSPFTAKAAYSDYVLPRFERIETLGNPDGALLCYRAIKMFKSNLQIKSIEWCGGTSKGHHTLRL